jgi:hypothetical protein
VPRGRVIYPNFWTDSKVVKLSPFARLLFIGSWNFAYCDKGHLDDDPDGLKLKILPADAVDPLELVAEIMSQGLLVRDETPDGRPFLRVPNFPEYQAKDDPRWNTKCPICRNHDKPQTTTDVVSVEGRGVERSRGEGSTRVARPPRYCSKHPEGTDGGCFRCRDARLAQQEWDEAQKNTPKPSHIKKPRRGDGHTCVDMHGWCSKCGERMEQ